MAPRVLVTGGTGMIGAALARRLVGEGCEVSIVAREGSSRLRLRGIEDRIRWWAADIRDGDGIRRVVAESRPDVVYHLASTPFNPPTIPATEHLQTIVLGTGHLLDALRDRPDVRVIATGSAAEYGSGAGLREDMPLHPGTVLGAAKASAGLLMRSYAGAYGMRTIWLRIFTPYGGWERPARLIPHTILSALEGRDVRLTSGAQRRDYFYIEDLVEALRLAAGADVPGGTVLNVCSGQGIAVREVVGLVLRLMGSSVRAEVGALPMRSDEIQESSGDNAAAKARLGWQPRTSLEDGLRQTIEWFRRHRELAHQLS